MSVTVPAPPEAATGDESSPRSWAWLFMRVSGVLLLVLAGLHFADRWLVHDITEATALSMGERWTNGWWRFTDFAFVVLATAHALVGLHWWTARHVPSGTVRLGLEGVVGSVVAVLAVLAAWTVLTF